MNFFCLSPKVVTYFGSVLKRIIILLAEITTDCIPPPSAGSFLPTLWSLALGGTEAEAALWLSSLLKTVMLYSCFFYILHEK